MANLSVACHICGKTAQVKSQLNIGSLQFITYGCGHAYSRPIPKSETAEIDEFTSLRNQHPFPYQSKTVQFLEKAGLRGIVNHEMGLGKTIIECVLLKRNAEHLYPALIICPVNVVYQWYVQLVNWTREVPQILTTKRPMPNFQEHDIFIVSVDSLHRLPWIAMEKANEVRQKKLANIARGGTWDTPVESKDRQDYVEIRRRFKHICIDEVQRIKNPTALRTQAVKKLAVEKSVVTLSGTPIKNNAGEYFTALNVVRPDIFPTEAGFLRQHCNIGYYGKIQGLRNPQRFKELTQDWIIRYERKDVMPELPKIFRQFHSSIMESDADKDAYDAVLEQFEDFMDDHENVSAMEMTNILAYFAKMRHITGLAKIDACVEYVETFLLENDRKIAIFAHHKDVIELLNMKLSRTCEAGAYAKPLLLTAECSSQERLKLTEEFWKPENRIMILSTLAGGEGINLQCCSDCIILERQWNPANEEQAEARFPRPRADGIYASQINVIYMISAGTIDDMLTELVEKKRSIMVGVLNGENTKWDESSLMRELMTELKNKGRSKWKASLQ